MANLKCQYGTKVFLGQSIIPINKPYMAIWEGNDKRYFRTSNIKPPYDSIPLEYGGQKFYLVDSITSGNLTVKVLAEHQTDSDYYHQREDVGGSYYMVKWRRKLRIHVTNNFSHSVSIKYNLKGCKYKGNAWRYNATKTEIVGAGQSKLLSLTYYSGWTDRKRFSAGADWDIPSDNVLNSYVHVDMYPENIHMKWDKYIDKGNNDGYYTMADLTVPT